MISRRTAAAVVRGAAIERCLIGVLLLGRPGAVSGLIARDERQPPAWLVQVLGARLLAQGLVGLARPGRTMTFAGATVDSAHALSMLAAAALLPSYRRTATASAGEATLSALMGFSAARRLP